MPTEPPPANPSTNPVPHGQVPANPQHLAQQRQQLRYSHPHLPHLHQPQYGAAPPRNMSQQQPPSPQPQQQQQIPQQQQQQPPRQGMNPNHPYYPVNGYPPQLPPYPNQVAPQFSVNGYVYHQPPFSYTNMQPASPAQQPAPQNVRNRPYSQPAPSHGPPRQTTSRLPVQPRKKVVLAIVDPETNEEVKVSKVPSKPPSSTPPPASSASVPTVKIPARTSHALELVADPDDPNDTIPRPTHPPADSPQPFVPASAGDTHVASPQPVPAVSVASQSSKVDSAVPPSRANNSEEPLPQSAQPPPSQSGSSTEHSAASTQISGQSSSVESRGNQRVAANTKSSGDHITQTPPPARSFESTNTGLGKEETSEAQSATPASEVESEEQMSGAAGSGEDATSDSSPTPRRERPLHKEGDRYLYPPQWMMEMRSHANLQAAAKYETTLLERSISSKSNPGTNMHRGDPRRPPSSRGSSGSLSGDPRGMRAFPAQGSSGFQHVPTRGSGSMPPGMAGGGGVGSYEAFDFRSARSQAPPPVSKGTPGRDGDPRGSRTPSGGRGGRFDGPTRHGQGPLDPFISHIPVEKLKKTDKGWKRDKDSDDDVTGKVKHVRSLLNKLTLEKFDKIFKQIIDIDISSLEVLRGVVVEVFEKTLFEPKFSGMYAELCLRLDGATKEMLQRSNFLDSKGSPITFRKILLNNCQEEFLRFARSCEESERNANEASDKSSKKDDKTKDGSDKSENNAAKDRQRKEEAAINAQKAKRRMLANVKFIGELFLKDLLKEAIIHQKCIQRLLGLGIESKEEDVLEALCKLISKTGARLSANIEAKAHIDGYFAHILKLSHDHTLPARIRFMLQDLIEQRENGWRVRREEAGAKTIAEIHKDIEKEERAKAEAQAAVRERKNRGPGGSHGRDRGSSVPHVAMTMPMAKQKSNSSMSRSAMLMERVSKNTTGMSPTISMHLGPGGAKLGGGGGGSGGSLRPHTRFGSFSALADSRESGGNNQSGDARRLGKMSKWQTNRPRAEAKSGAPEGMKSKTKEVTLDAESLKRKTNAIVKEYFEIGDFAEVVACLEEEIQKANYGKFMEEALKTSLSTKASLQDKCISLIAQLFEKVMSRGDFEQAVCGITSQLSDIEMDDPRAGEFLATYLGNAGARVSQSEGVNRDFGLGFLKNGVECMSDGKRITKLMVMTYRELYKALTESISDERERKAAVAEAYELVGVDIVARMKNWNEVGGVEILSEMLKDMNMEFLVPYLGLEKALSEVLESNGNSSGVSEVLSCWKKEEVKVEGVARIVTGLGLKWVLKEEGEESVKKRVGEVIGGPLAQYCDGVVSRDVQMAVLLEAQRMFGEWGEWKGAQVVFEAFYDADLVDEDTFLSWKEDTEQSIKIEGKDKMIIQTCKFFKWLAEAEVEDG